MGDITIYLRLRNRHYIKPGEKIYLRDIAQVIAPENYESQVKNLMIEEIKDPNQHLVVIDVMGIIRIISHFFPGLIVESIGSPEIIVEILNKKLLKKPNLFLVAFVWCLLFIGSGLAIMNFHHDVSMVEVHRRLYFLLTGEEVKKPLIIQIPYSLGIGLGMVLFFNHIFKKKINEEPSPLEVEMFLYQKNLDKYVVMSENKENNKRVE